MTALDPGEGVDGVAFVRQFTEAFLSARLEEMTALLAPDCHDRNPEPHQPTGAFGVVWKAALFHAVHGGFETRFGAVVTASGLVVAEWVTTFADGTVTQWRGDFMVSRGQIRRFEVHRVG